MGGERTIAFDFCCNDPDNGIFAGRAVMIQCGEMELEARNWSDRGYAFTVLDGAVRIHRRRFTFIGGKDWVGNWCWNRYVMRRPEGKRLLGVLRSSGRWRCTAGPSHLYDWFNCEGRFALDAPSSTET